MNVRDEIDKLMETGLTWEQAVQQVLDPNPKGVPDDHACGECGDHMAPDGCMNWSCKNAPSVLTLAKATLASLQNDCG